MEKLNMMVSDNNLYDMETIAGRIERIYTFLNGRDAISNYSNTIDGIVSRHLIEIGMPPSLKGYRYIITAIKEVLKDETVLEGITKILYPSVAKSHNSTPQRVEKAMRHAIEVAWSRNADSKLKEEFKYSTSAGKTRPTNSEFIAILSQYIKMSQI